jgi:hypothetical protein
MENYMKLTNLNVKHSWIDQSLINGGYVATYLILTNLPTNVSLKVLISS